MVGRILDNFVVGEGNRWGMFLIWQLQSTNQNRVCLLINTKKSGRPTVGFNVTRALQVCFAFVCNFTYHPCVTCHSSDTWATWILANYRPTKKWSRKHRNNYITSRWAIQTFGRDFFTELDVTLIKSRRTEPIIGSLSHAFDLEFRLTVAISGCNLRRTSA